MKVFISGVAGFLGSHLADAFLAKGDDVTGVDSLIGGDRDNVPAGVDFKEWDCNQRGACLKMMRGCDVVYHLAATAHEGLSVFSPFENAQNGYLASASIFSAAIEARVRRIVFASSMARYGSQTPPFTEEMTPRPQDPYGVGKWAAEMLLKNLSDIHGVEWTVAVPHNIYGPRSRHYDPFRNVAPIFANLMLQGRQPYIYGDGSQERCFSYVSDCVGPLVRMATAKNVVGETINIGPDDEVVTILKLAQTIAQIIGFRLDPTFIEDRPLDVKVAHCSADKARKLIGYEPRVSLEVGLRETIDWILKKGPRKFEYHLGLEINNELVPQTWKQRLF